MGNVGVCLWIFYLKVASIYSNGYQLIDSDVPL